MDNTVSYITTCGKLTGKKYWDYGPVARDVYILHYIISGKGYLDFGDKHITLVEGQSFLIRPFLPVHYYSDSEDPWEYIWVDFRGNEFEKLIGNIQFQKSNCVIEYTAPQYVLPLMESIYREYNGEDHKNFHKNFCNGLLTAILGIYTDLYPAPENSIYTQQFSFAQKLIEENYQNKNFQTKHIAEKLNLSNSSLYRLFKEFAGISPNRYLINYRIAVAKNLIDSGEKIHIASQMCGYDDPLYFSRVFKSVTGMSPKHYSQQNPAKDAHQETYMFLKKEMSENAP